MANCGYRTAANGFSGAVAMTIESMAATPHPASMSEPAGARRATIDTLQVGRFLAAFAVLLFHANLTLALPKYFGVEYAPAVRAGFSGVEFFFILSGFIIALAHWRDQPGAAAVKQFALKRFVRLYPPLWVAIGLVVVAMIGLGTADFTSPVFLRGVIETALLIPAKEEVILAVAWTLRHEVLFYAVFAIWLWKPQLGWPLAIFMLLGSVAGGFIRSDYPIAFLFSPHNALFGMGVAAAWAYRTRGTLIRHPLTLLGIGAGLFAVIWVLVSMGLASPRTAVWPFGLGAMLAVLGAASWEAQRRPTMPRILVFLGDASYSIYLIHFIAISLAAKFAVRLDAMLPLPGLIWFVVVSAAALVAGVGFHLIIERPLLRMSRDWIARGKGKSKSAISAG